MLQSCPELHHEDVEHETRQPGLSADAEAALGQTLVLAVSIAMDEQGLQKVQAMLREVRAPRPAWHDAPELQDLELGSSVWCRLHLLSLPSGAGNP